MRGKHTIKNKSWGNNVYFSKPNFKKRETGMFNLTLNGGYNNV